MKRLLHIMLAGILAGTLCSCVTVGKGADSAQNAIPERFTLPEYPRDHMPPQEGSIYNDQRSLDIYRDRRARAVGDLILIKIVETSSGEKKAETKTSRASTITADLTSLFGFEQSIQDKNHHFSPTSPLQAGLSNSFDGKGETTRDSQVTATLSGRVIDVTMDGNLVIRGYREVKVNNETQHIILSGIVRPADISIDNSVLSSYIADARIEYSGKGIITDKQQPGWLARVFDVVWPF